MSTRFHRPLAFLTALALLLSGSAFVHAQGAGTSSPEKIDLYLLIGQSNMAGRGRVSAEDKKPNPRVQSLSQDLIWKPAVAPLHFDKPAVVGVGVGRSFAFEMLKSTPDDVTIGLIPAAAGGSPIDSWKPGGFHRQTKSHPYDDALKRARHAMKTGRLKGILWHQGESDSKPKLAAAYEAKLHELIKRLRKDLNAEDVPFVAGEMGQFKERPWNDGKKQVDQAHRDLPKHIQRTAFVNSKGLKHKGDQVHFDAASYRELGKRYAAAMKKLLENSPKD